MQKTWKSIERKIADYFGTKRTPLSGGNSGHTRSDTLHPRLFVETKYRKVFSVIGLWRQVRDLAKKEGKTPVVCLSEKGKPGFWLLIHSSNLLEIAEEKRKIGTEG